MGSKEPVVVLSDHANLRYFMNAQTLTPRQARWASFLSEFHFDILHTPGKDNPDDPASRRPDYTSNGAESIRVTLLGRREVDCIEVFAVNLFSRKTRSRVDHSCFMRPDQGTITEIQSAYHDDQELMGRKKAYMTFNENVWWWWDRVYVPETLRKKVMHLFHAPATAGHWGVAKTLDLLTRSFNWPNTRADLLVFVASCTSCQQVKIDRRPPQGKLMPLPIPDRPWSTIGVDFIVKLPISFGYDSIMVVVDHLTKAAHFIPALESWKADDLARAFVTEIF